jgi:phospholipase/carboxylesterase
MDKKTIKIGELNVTVVKGNGKPKGAAILCHGFGAGGDDLVGIAEEMAAADKRFADVAFLFPAAPLELDPEDDSRAWWMIDLEQIQDLVEKGEFRDLKSECPVELSECSEQIKEVIWYVHEKMGIDHSKIVLGGFSQGAMLTTDVALNYELPLAALIIWSGALICEDKWQAAAEKVKFPVFQSHGTMDPLLPFDNAVDLCNLLTDADLDVDFNEFDGPHTIAESGFMGAMKLMRKVLKL